MLLFKMNSNPSIKTCRFHKSVAKYSHKIGKTKIWLMGFCFFFIYIFDALIDGLKRVRGQCIDGLGEEIWRRKMQPVKAEQTWLGLQPCDKLLGQN